MSNEELGNEAENTTDELTNNVVNDNIELLDNNDGDKELSNNDLEDEVVVSIGEDSLTSNEEQHKAPDWVRELRKTNREVLRRNKELEAKLTSITGAENKPVESLGVKPKLDDFDYETEQYEKALESWYERKRSIEEQTTRENVEKENRQKSWELKIDSYNKAKTSLKVKDFDEAEYTVQDNFSITQQGIILQGAEDPALVVYALGKSPKKAKELGLINDPVKFAFAIAKLETQMKVTKRKSVTEPEKAVRGNGSTSSAVDSQLDRLRDEALRTGDLSKVIAYKRRMKSG
jgi:hypothetical protein